jgi:hypothetical protein
MAALSPMRFEEWEPTYRAVLRDFGYERVRDEEAARLLDSLLAGPLVPEEELADRLRGREVTVAGNAASLGSELAKLRGVLIAADEATSVLTAAGRRPDLLVTDLDGRVEDQVAANARGTVAVIHAHGDNMAALREWVPRFTGRVVATTQSAPEGRVRNYGGFTDGDRGVCLAAHFGAGPIRLAGFDFETPNEKDLDAATKRRKLDWAYLIVQGQLGFR